MGKKNKKSAYDKKDFLGKYEANNKMAKAYGIDSSEYQTRHGQVRPGGYSTKKSFEQYEKDIANAAANDYDVRRSLEAAKLAGNEKAMKIGNVNDLSSAFAATKFMKNTHKKRMGNGGAYDGANDQAGVTDYWVNKDREKQNSMFATKDDLSAMQQQQAAEAAVEEEPYIESEALTNAKERVAAWENSNAGTDPSPYGGDSGADFSSMVYGGGSEDQAQSQLDKFKAELKDRKNFQPNF